MVLRYSFSLWNDGDNKMYVYWLMLLFAKKKRRVTLGSDSVSTPCNVGGTSIICEISWSKDHTSLTPHFPSDAPETLKGKQFA